MIMDRLCFRSTKLSPLTRTSAPRSRAWRLAATIAVCLVAQAMPASPTHAQYGMRARGGSYSTYSARAQTASAGRSTIGRAALPPADSARQLYVSSARAMPTALAGYYPTLQNRYPSQRPAPLYVAPRNAYARYQELHYSQAMKWRGINLLGRRDAWRR
jgi:hypothetical protein